MPDWLIPVIAGGGGGLVAVIVLIVCLVWARRRRRRRGYTKVRSGEVKAVQLSTRADVVAQRVDDLFDFDDDDDDGVVFDADEIEQLKILEAFRDGLARGAPGSVTRTAASSSAAAQAARDADEHDPFELGEDEEDGMDFDAAFGLGDTGGGSLAGRKSATKASAPSAARSAARDAQAEAAARQTTASEEP